MDDIMVPDGAVKEVKTVIKTSTPTPTPTKEVTTSLSFMCVGDNLIHSQLINTGLSYGGDWSYMYENMIPYIQAADVAVINEETMLVDDPAEYSGYPAFGTPYGVADAEISAGFDIFTCATNHSLDKWRYGIDCTVAYYNTYGICYTGIQGSDDQASYTQYKIYEKNGIRCAILNYTYGLNGYSLPEGYPYMVHTFDDEARIRNDIAAANADADVVLAFVHWGDEYSPYVNSFQEYWTNVFYECGVDVVVGSHPHVVEPYQMIDDGAGHQMLVYYSLGNFVSNQDELPDMVGGMANFTIKKTGDKVTIEKYSMSPVVTHFTEPMRSTAYLLTDYTEDLASQHLLGVTLDGLWNVWNSYTSWS